MALITIETPVLSVGCLVTGPEDGQPLMLLHGWPDVAQSWDGLLPALHNAGYRTVAPFLRGHGPTRFRDAATMRSGEVAALAQDVLDLADALGLERFGVVGHDWGARAAYTVACVAPERLWALAALATGWDRNDPDQPVSMPQNQAYWYQWLMGLERGAALLRNDRRGFTRHIWQAWSPGWPVPEDDFAVAAAGFDNPDWAEVAVHSYRVRWSLAPKDPAHAAVVRQVASSPVIGVPTLMLQGGADPVALPQSSEGKDPLFSGGYERVVLDGLGHFPHRQGPDAVLDRLLPFLRRHRGD